MPQHEGNGAWPYWLPYLGFFCVIGVSDHVPVALAPLIHFAKVAVPMGLLLYFGARRCYPELCPDRVSASKVICDVLVGLAGAALWIAPYLLFDSFMSLVPSADQDLDLKQVGASSGWLVLIWRVIGFGCVTPFMEELFVRSWLQRFAEVFDETADFRSVAIGHFSVRSFLIVLAWFMFSHQMWEWPVAAAWVILTQCWFYYRRSLLALVIVHATTNLTIFATVVAADRMCHDAAGIPASLWFFL